MPENEPFEKVPKPEMPKNVIEFSDFQKLDLRVAEIKKVEEIEGADKLYKLTIDVGELGERVICAGIKPYYSAKELQGKKIIIIANLASRKLRGIESQGMLLAAGGVNKDKCVLLTVEKDIESGTKIS
jgi:methionyl-tRNA synthetase